MKIRKNLKDDGIKQPNKGEVDSDKPMASFFCDRKLNFIHVPILEGLDERYITPEEWMTLYGEHFATGKGSSKDQVAAAVGEAFTAHAHDVSGQNSNSRFIEDDAEPGCSGMQNNFAYVDPPPPEDSDHSDSDRSNESDEFADEELPAFEEEVSTDYDDDADSCDSAERIRLEDSLNEQALKLIQERQRAENLRKVEQQSTESGEESTAMVGAAAQAPDRSAQEKSGSSQRGRVSKEKSSTPNDEVSDDFEPDDSFMYDEVSSNEFDGENTAETELGARMLKQIEEAEAMLQQKCDEDSSADREPDFCVQENAEGDLPEPTATGKASTSEDEVKPEALRRIPEQAAIPEKSCGVTDSGSSATEVGADQAPNPDVQENVDGDRREPPDVREAQTFKYDSVHAAVARVHGEEISNEEFNFDQGPIRACSANEEESSISSAVAAQVQGPASLDCRLRIGESFGEAIEAEVAGDEPNQTATSGRQPEGNGFSESETASGKLPSPEDKVESTSRQGAEVQEPNQRLAQSSRTSSRVVRDYETQTLQIDFNGEDTQLSSPSVGISSSVVQGEEIGGETEVQEAGARPFESGQPIETDIRETELSGRQLHHAATDSKGIASDDFKGDDSRDWDVFSTATDGYQTADEAADTSDTDSMMSFHDCVESVSAYDENYDVDPSGRCATDGISIRGEASDEGSNESYESHENTVIDQTVFEPPTAAADAIVNDQEEFPATPFDATESSEPQTSQAGTAEAASVSTPPEKPAPHVPEDPSARPTHSEIGEARSQGSERIAEDAVNGFSTSSEMLEDSVGEDEVDVPRAVMEDISSTSDEHEEDVFSPPDANGDEDAELRAEDFTEAGDSVRTTESTIGTPDDLESEACLEITPTGDAPAHPAVNQPLGGESPRPQPAMKDGIAGDVELAVNGVEASNSERSVTTEGLEKLKLFLKSAGNPQVKRVLFTAAATKDRNDILKNRKSRVINAIGTASRTRVRNYFDMLREHMLRIKYLAHTKSDDHLPISGAVMRLVWEVTFREFETLEDFINEQAAVFSSQIASVKAVEDIAGWAEYDGSSKMIQKLFHACLKQSEGIQARKPSLPL